MFDKLRSLLAAQLLAGLTALAAAAPAPAAVVLTFNTATATDVDYTITGLYTDLFSGLSFSSGPWTVTLDSPVPAPELGSGDEWSVRLVLEYAGLSGNRTDNFGADLGPPHGITTFAAAQFSGTLSLAHLTAGAALDVTGKTTWRIDGDQLIDRSFVVSEPAPLALLCLGLTIAGVARRYRAG
jgi:hypothetical protein